jgi:pimeloyl-ACP methyl ester carboxylesterase
MMTGSVLRRCLFLALLVAGTWIGATQLLGNRGEAFWLLFPLWVFAGVRVLRVFPAPRPQYQRPLAKWIVRVVLVLFPAGLAEVPVAFTRMVGWVDGGFRVEQADATAAIRGLRTPIFFIHGLEDSTIPAECSRILFDRYGGPKKLRLEPGAGHGGTALLDVERYREELGEFFLAASRQQCDSR